MPVAHTPNGDHQTYLAHFESALSEWIRTGILGAETELRNLIMSAIEHPSPEALAAASEQSQDGSVVYNFNTADGSVAVAPAIPHTEETAAAAKEAGRHAVPATTSTATASSEQLADVSRTEGATPDNPEGGEGTTTIPGNESGPTGEGFEPEAAGAAGI